MVHINFPPNLTEEEEILRQKYARLRKKKKQLQALKSAKPEREPTKEKPIKRPTESAEDAKEQAKKLIMSGAIKLSDKKEKQGFKRSRNLEKKLLDPDKAPSSVGFTPFSATHVEEERDERDSRRSKQPRIAGLYDNFVRGDSRIDREEKRDGIREDRRTERKDDRREDRRDERRDRERRDRSEPLPKKGNTVYVNGHGVAEDTLRKAFSNFGTIVNVSMEKERNCGFVTFDQMDSADMAIQEVDGAMIDGVQLRVSMARRQPSFEPALQDPSTTSWASIASNNSQKGSHRDKRNVVEYEEDMF